MDYSNSASNDLSKVFDDPQAKAVFWSTYRRWQMALDTARSMAIGSLPPNAFDLGALLVRIPALPSRIPGHLEQIEGFSTWKNENTSATCNLKRRSDIPSVLRLRWPVNTRCSLSPEASFQVWKTSTNNGLALLVLGWAYILNASLVERQGLRLKHRPVAPLPATTGSPNGIFLPYATEQEVSWWRTIIRPGKFCLSRGEKHLPWAVLLEDVCSLEISQGKSTSDSLQLPTAKMAATYLARFCAAYNLGDQVEAAFAAALCIPTRASCEQFNQKLNRVTLPLVSLPSSPDLPESYENLPPYLESLSYFMTLSLSSNVFWALLESVLWQPDVPCNLAGWALQAAYKVLGPVIQSEGYELLAKVLSSTNIASLWLGSAVCNWMYPLDFCMKSGDNFSRMTAKVAPWTGIAHSFFDIESLGPYLKPNDMISRADIWRLRRDCADKYPKDEDYRIISPLPWRPFGFMHSKDAEVEIQDHIKCSHCWTYQFWTWLLPPTHITDNGYTIESCQPRSPMPLPLTNMDNQDGGLADIDEEHMEVMRRISCNVTRRVFLWCAHQIERGFTHNVVPRHRFDDEQIPDEQQGDRYTVDPDKICEWRDKVIACLEAEDELS